MQPNLSITCPCFRITAITKMLKTFLKTVESKMSLGDPPFKETIIIALKPEDQRSEFSKS